MQNKYMIYFLFAKQMYHLIQFLNLHCKNGKHCRGERKTGVLFETFILLHHASQRNSILKFK
jgi:hypothetical protein